MVLGLRANEKTPLLFIKIDRSHLNLLTTNFVTFIEGGVIEGGVIEGGAIEGGAIEGGAIEGGVFEGGVFEGGVIDKTS